MEFGVKVIKIINFITESYLRGAKADATEGLEYVVVFMSLCAWLKDVEGNRLTAQAYHYYAARDNGGSDQFLASVSFSQPQDTNGGREDNAHFPDSNDIAHFGYLHGEQDDQVGKIREKPHYEDSSFVRGPFAFYPSPLFGQNIDR